jgi:hypothetical protein
VPVRVRLRADPPSRHSVLRAYPPHLVARQLDGGAFFLFGRRYRISRSRAPLSAPGAAYGPESEKPSRRLHDSAKCRAEGGAG